MGLSNILVVRCGTGLLPPDKQYLVPFRKLDRVVWGVVCAGGTHDDAQTENVLDIPNHLTNMTGIMLDDFFLRPADEGNIGVLTLEQVRDLRNRLVSIGNPDIWVVVYDHQLDQPIGQYLYLCDKATLWTWEGKNLESLEQNFEKLEKIAPPQCGRLLGCYMWDYGGKRPMPMDLMKRQCEAGLRWLKEGRIEGIIFLASSICDLELETVEWVRHWISEVGGETV
jgi:hypothetical protein